MKPLYKKYRFLLIPVLVILMVLVGSFTLLVPQIQSLLNAYQETQTLTQKNIDLTQKRSVLESINRQSLASNLGIALDAMPNDKELSSLLLTIENVSLKSQLDLDSVQLAPGSLATAAATAKSAAPVGEVVKRRGADALRVSALVRGTTAQLKTFLDTLNSSTRLFDIESIDITYQIDTPDTLQSAVVLLAYFLPPTPTIAGVDTPISPLTANEQKTLTDLSQFLPLGKAPLGETESSTIQQPVGKPDLFN